MGLVSSLLRREDRFAGLLAASAAQVQANVKALDQLLHSPSPAVSLKAFLQSRAKEQEILAEIDALLCRRYRTPLDHADVEALARSLDRIAKGLRKFAERYLICAAHIREVSFTPQLNGLAATAGILHEMVASLGVGPRVGAIKERDNMLQKLDEEAAQLFQENMVALYQGRHDPMTAIMLKDLYEQLNRVFDRCRSTGDLVLQIVLKHS